MSFISKLNKYKYSLRFSLLITFLFALLYFISESIINENFILGEFLLQYLPFLFLFFLTFFFIIQWNIERIVKKDIIRFIKEISNDSNQDSDIANLNLELDAKVF